MKRATIIFIIALSCLGSCNEFLEENPTSFLSPGEFYSSQAQISAAVNGCYLGLGFPWGSIFFGYPYSAVFMIEYLTGYSHEDMNVGSNEAAWLNPQDPIDNNNPYMDIFWQNYMWLENCNSAIDNISKTNIIDEVSKNNYLGEVYFLRAYYYFQTVRLFGSVPLKTTPTADLSNIEISKAPIDDIYTQIVEDLTTAEQSSLPWTDQTGHVSMGAVKSLLAEVYLTMAGYPLQKGNEYYQKAFDKAKEVIGSSSFILFPDYADIRDPANSNSGENIFMLQCDPDINPNLMTYGLLPYNNRNLLNSALGGAMSPDVEFYNSYSDSDLRKTGFFYTTVIDKNDPSNIITLSKPYILKYWNDEDIITGRYGANIPLMRYAGLLLVCAEAKASLDGGTTSDPDAIDAYYQVHNRAFPDAVRPASITFEEVFKERSWELCYEFQTWFDMIRTRKAFDVVNNSITDVINYQAPNHIRPFKERDLLIPISLAQIQLNPKLEE